MNEDKLNRVLQLHTLWIDGVPEGVCADLGEADLRGANLRGANLRMANLRWANLRRADLSKASLSDANLILADLGRADLSEADLREANLSEAVLRGANLREADLRGADLSGADLRDANLSEANLRGANLRGANLRGANLRGAGTKGVIHDEFTCFFSLQCPEKGPYIGYKSACGAIVELLIPDDALRSSATSRKCRASKATVLSISDKDGNQLNKVHSDYSAAFVYRVGETVEVLDFEKNRWVECAPGIHHFITRKEAEMYGQRY